MIELPAFPEQGRHSYYTPIEGTTYQVRMTWRQRLGAWYMDLCTQSGEQIGVGRRLRPRLAPFEVVSSENMPRVLIWVVGSDEYNRGDLGQSLRVFIYTSEDLA